jgi:hypothetical protein
MYYALKHFAVLFKVSTFSLIQNWIDTVTTAESRSIESVTFIFDLTYEVKHNIRFVSHPSLPALLVHFCTTVTATLSFSVSAIVNFVKLLGRLYEMGLARSAVQVFYVADVPDRRFRVRLEAAQFLRWCVDIHETSRLVIVDSSARPRATPPRTLLDQKGLEGWTRVQLRKAMDMAVASLVQLRDSLNRSADYQHSSPVLDGWKQCDYFQGIVLLSLALRLSTSS